MTDFPSTDRLAQMTPLALKKVPDSPLVTDYRPIQLRYKMMGYDSVLDIADTWIVSGAPDYLGAFYGGSLTKPLRGVAILWNSLVK